VNSLLRESQNIESTYTPLELRELGHSEQSFSFYNRQGLKVLIPIKSYSLTGRHLLDGQSYVQTKLNHYSRLSFEDIIAELTSLYEETSSEARALFLARVFESTKFLQEVLADQGSALQEFYAGDHFSFIEAEQALVIGHTFHPYPKSREGFDHADL